MTQAVKLALVFLGSGVVGWVLENTFANAPRYSRAFLPRKVPFLPVYAVGGTLVALAGPAFAPLPIWCRMLAYGAGLTGLEYAACRVDRAMGGCSWDYATPSACERPTPNGAGCVDASHLAAWAVLGAGVDLILRKTIR
jgi:uncharacterized membrane protein